jgi:hypothetical protein
MPRPAHRAGLISAPARGRPACAGTQKECLGRRLIAPVQVVNQHHDDPVAGPEIAQNGHHRD